METGADQDADQSEDGAGGPYRHPEGAPPQAQEESYNSSHEVNHKELGAAKQRFQIRAEVAVEGTAIRPPRSFPDPVPARDRGGLVGAPHNGQTEAPRSISPRQLGHMRSAAS